MKINPIPLVLHLFTLLFVALQLTGFIGWSWWLVLLPSYGPFSLGLVLLAIGGTLRNMTPEQRAQAEAAEAIDALRAALKARNA